MANYLTVPGAQVTEAERRFIRDIAVAYNNPQAVLVNIGIIPARQILSISSTGFGSLIEDELVVIGPVTNSEVIN